MSIKDILVHVDDGKPVEARLRAAANLAARYGAHLTGLYVAMPPTLPGYVAVEIPIEIIEIQAGRAKETQARAERQFHHALETARVEGDWRAEEGDPSECLTRQARYHDLVVLGQQEDPPLYPDMPDLVVLSAGRPVLVIPYVGRYDQIGERVMVAWDGSRTAARALNDALPILGRAGNVGVIGVGPGQGDRDPGRGDDICRYLARHGVKAEAGQAYAEDISVADMLLSRAADGGADLFVMGAYGHARWRELVLGGVTRHMLAHMTLPIFMSH